MALEINAQFNKFLQFAESQANPAKSEAIARVTGKEDALVGRAISASATDRVRGVFKWGKRSGAEEARNNETRAIFKKAVADIFGGEGKIPQSVKKAMLLGDYDCGKPLTARRIMAVQKALRPYIIGDAVDRAADFMNGLTKKIGKSESLFDAKPPSPQQRQEAMRIVKRYGSGLNEWGLRTLANAVVYAMSRGYDPRAEARRVKEMIGPYRDFKPGDARFAAVDAKVLVYNREILKDYLTPEKDDFYNNEGVFTNFIIDANRTDYAIDGDEMNRDMRVVDVFKEKIKSVQHRKALSCFFCQMSMGLINLMGRRQPMDDPPSCNGFVIMDQPGAEMFAGQENAESLHQGNALIPREPRISLEVLDGGTHAKMRIEAESTLQFANDDDPQDFGKPIGIVNVIQELEFDLSGEEAVLTSAHIGQDLKVDFSPANLAHEEQEVEQEVE